MNWSHKRRWIALGLLIAGILVMLLAPPIIPVIQLPGEKFPAGWDILGLRITNSLFGSAIVWVLLAALVIYVVRKMPKSGAETPAGGFYNIFEMTFEGLYNFISGIGAGPYLGTIFRMFMTIFMIVLLSNWLELIPGVDSIGFLEAHVKTETLKDASGKEITQTTAENGGYDTYTGFLGISFLNPKCKWVSPTDAATLTADQIQARKNNGCTSGIGAAASAAPTGETAAAPKTEATPVAEATPGAANTSTNESVGQVNKTGEEAEPAHGASSVPWVVLPFVRAPSTDLNLTAALALCAVIMVQVMGFRALGLGYLTKFFNFKTLFSSPLGAIDVAVGLLELIGEFAKILSFSFRLLGNIFAGSILLFVMSFLVPFLPWPFFILEFFVGAIQAVVFGLLTAIFISQATTSHHHEEEHEEAHA